MKTYGHIFMIKLWFVNISMTKQFDDFTLLKNLQTAMSCLVNVHIYIVDSVPCGPGFCRKPCYDSKLEASLS